MCADAHPNHHSEGSCFQNPMHICPAHLPFTPAPHPCPAHLPRTSPPHTCPAHLPCTSPPHPCPAHLPRTSAPHIPPAHPPCTPALQDNFAGEHHPLSWIDAVHAKSTPLHRWLVLLDAAAYVATTRLDLSVVKPDFVDLSFYK